MSEERSSAIIRASGRSPDSQGSCPYVDPEEDRKPSIYRLDRRPHRETELYTFLAFLCVSVTLW